MAGGETVHQMAPWVGEEERAAASAYLASGGWLTEFTHTSRFSRMVADYVGSTHGFIMSSGTTALCASLAALKIGRGDEVIVPDLTMIATATAVTWCGATPVLVDIDPETLCLDLELAERAVGPKTRAIMLVSLNGRAPNMSRAVDLAARRGLALVEDAAQSLGASWGGRHLGTFGRIGCFSFSAPKIITTGQGGACVTDDDELATGLRMVRDFGRTRGGVDEHETVGFNFKFTDLQAVVGIEQMKKLDSRVARKKAMFGRYQQRLASIPEVTMLSTDLEAVPPWFIDVLVPEPAALQRHLAARGIGARLFYPALHTQAPYARDASCPHAVHAASHGLWLPSSSFLDDDTIDRVCDDIAAFYRSSPLAGRPLE